MKKILRLLGKLQYLWDGGGSQLRGERNFRRVAKEGQRILDVSRGGGEKFWTSPEEGGGAKNFRLGQYFCVPKTQFFYVLWVF